MQRYLSHHGPAKVRNAGAPANSTLQTLCLADHDVEPLRIRPTSYVAATRTVAVFNLLNLKCRGRKSWSPLLLSRPLLHNTTSFNCFNLNGWLESMRARQ
jgi:hypothetical protein